MTQYKILSCFDGISACQVALKNLGIEYDYYASEIDKYAISVTKNNFPNTIHLGDVKLINGYDYKDVELLCGGSPCQSFSIAGSQKGFEDPRGELFWEYVRILNEVKPKFFIFENVNSMKQRDKDIISKAFGFEPIVINSALLTAQQRKRLFYVGALQKDGTYKKVEIEQPQDKNKTVWEILELEPNIKVENFDDFTPISEDRVNGRFGFHKTTKRLGHFNSGGQGDRVYSRFGKSVCLSANGGGRGAKCGLYLTKYNEIRKLTPIECERLQGFPDGFTSEISNTRRYQCLGNSFTVPVIEHILKTILK
jgi:DNA (cytosine-5)-methyltransferase 3A